jgi:hypothetical protein
MEHFYRRSTLEEGKNVAGKGELYYVEDVTLSGGVLTTKSGALLMPLPSPSPLPSVPPEVEPTVIPTTPPAAKMLVPKP